ncbi:MAG: type II toxin-antitoxin system VapC family toxin [Gomphosphaeria aponina SAG 52.96 = DSM 107014]|uniref:Type II toxin-antitoxin system VapC family toxin n=1 Tax=Gomphosphaeria aponina SAG 52.96 = DSM 107014 TaxID=1521640 RepID=A0A941GSG2_9CHRO|nr:type II toxin-antitoxin system VapC family toxin [Gomphosphaeria aponina SAG 52.96 = DSM 107014]
MKLLLDTHIWLWYLLGNSRLSNNLIKTIEDETNQLYLSPVSIWEALLLGEKQKVILQPTSEEWIKDSLEQLEVIEAPLSIEIAILSRKLNLAHQDPADRFIAATAVHYNLILATVDQNLTNATCFQTLS